MCFKRQQWSCVAAPRAAGVGRWWFCGVRVGWYQAEAAVLGCKYPRHVRPAVGSGVGRHQSRGWLLRWLLLFLLLQGRLRRRHA